MADDQPYVRPWTAEATSPELPAHAYFHERCELFRARGADTVRMLQGAGKIPNTIDPESLATIMLAVADGLQTQWLYDQRIDMAEHFLLRFWDQVGRLGAPVASHPR